MVLNVTSKEELIRFKLKAQNHQDFFDSEAIKAVRRWQFKPKTIDGTAVDQMGELLVEFTCNV